MSDRVVCRSYTAARRHPTVVGVVGCWVLPVPVTITQLAVGVAVSVGLFAVRSWWARLPGAWNLLAAAVVVCAAMWAARQVRIGGRAPLWAAVGALRYAAGRLTAARRWRQRRVCWRPDSIAVAGD